MTELELTDPEQGVSVSVSIEHLYNEIGEQAILGDLADGSDFPYLAALALECWDDDDYTVGETLTEFCTASSTLRLSDREREQLRTILANK